MLLVTMFSITLYMLVKKRYDRSDDCKTVLFEVHPPPF